MADTPDSICDASSTNTASTHGHAHGSSAFSLLAAAL